MPRPRTAPMERTPILDAIPVNRPTSFGQTVLAYIALTKPRIIELLLITTIPTMFVAKRGVPGVWLMVATLIGGTLAAGGANAINMYVDRDIDALMDRTKGRPLVTGAMSPRAALTFAISIEVLAFAWLTWRVNLLSAVLAVSACLFYVFVYTLWLKRTSEQNIVIGGAAGAVPVLVGWSAVTNNLSWAPILLFFVIFVWTPPHFWALAVKYSEDYKAAGVPMMPVVATFERLANQIVAYTVMMWLATLVFVPVGKMGAIYGVTAVVLGAVFLGYALHLRKAGMSGQPTIKPAMRLFGWSITYLTLLFGVMILDQLV
jgi:heme o synthase